MLLQVQPVVKRSTLPRDDVSPPAHKGPIPTPLVSASVNTNPLPPYTPTVALRASTIFPPGYQYPTSASAPNQYSGASIPNAKAMFVIAAVVFSLVLGAGLVIFLRIICMHGWVGLLSRTRTEQSNEGGLKKLKKFNKTIGGKKERNSSGTGKDLGFHGEGLVVCQAPNAGMEESFRSWSPYAAPRIDDLWLHGTSSPSILSSPAGSSSSPGQPRPMSMPAALEKSRPVSVTWEYREPIVTTTALETIYEDFESCQENMNWLGIAIAPRPSSDEHFTPPQPLPSYTNQLHTRSIDQDSGDSTSSVATAGHSTDTTISKGTSMTSIPSTSSFADEPEEEEAEVSIARRVQTRSLEMTKGVMISPFSLLLPTAATMPTLVISSPSPCNSPSTASLGNSSSHGLLCPPLPGFLVTHPSTSSVASNSSIVSSVSVDLDDFPQPPLLLPTSIEPALSDGIDSSLMFEEPVMVC